MTPRGAGALRSALAALAALLALSTLPSKASAGGRESGTVLAVDVHSRSLTLDVYGQNSERRAIRVQVPPQALVLQAQRASVKGDFKGAFRETSITLADVRAGDYVVVEMSSDPEVARLVIVTLRRGDGS